MVKVKGLVVIFLILSLSCVPFLTEKSVFGVDPDEDIFENQNQRGEYPTDPDNESLQLHAYIGPYKEDYWEYPTWISDRLKEYSEPPWNLESNINTFGRWANYVSVFLIGVSGEDVIPRYDTSEFRPGSFLWLFSEYAVISKHNHDIAMKVGDINSSYAYDSGNAGVQSSIADGNPYYDPDAWDIKNGSGLRYLPKSRLRDIGNIQGTSKMARQNHQTLVQQISENLGVRGAGLTAASAALSAAAGVAGITGAIAAGPIGIFIGIFSAMCGVAGAIVAGTNSRNSYLAARLVLYQYILAAGDNGADFVCGAIECETTYRLFYESR